MLDLVESDLSPSVRGVSRLGLALPAFEHALVGFSLLLRQTACLGLLLFALGASCSGSPTSVPDASSPGSPLPLRGAACLDSVLLAVGMAHPDPFLSLRGCSRPGSAVSVLDFLHLAFSLFVHRLVQLGSFVSVLGPAQFGLVVCA